MSPDDHELDVDARGVAGGLGGGKEAKRKSEKVEKGEGKGSHPIASPWVMGGGGRSTGKNGDFKTICWDCKKGKYAQKHFSRGQCREVHGHSACDWRGDARQEAWRLQRSIASRKNGADGGGSRKEVRMGEGGRCTKCANVWVEEEEDGEDMRENGLLVCEDCRTVPLARAGGRRPEDSSDDDDENDDARKSSRPGKRGTKWDGDEEDDIDDDDDEEEEEVYEALDDQTVAEIASNLGLDAHEMLRVNKSRYTGLTLNSRLFAGTLLLLPQDDDEEEQPEEEEEEDRQRKGSVQVGRRRKGFSQGATAAVSGKGKKRARDWSDSEEDGEDGGRFSTAHGHRRWGNRWGSGVIDPRCHGLSSAKPMQCSYSQCAMPAHSGRGDGEHGWKIVTGQTRAGNQDWGRLTGRVFCNACFMQFATRGTLKRPGRAASKDSRGSESGDASIVEIPRDREGGREPTSHSPGRFVFSVRLCVCVHTYTYMYIYVYICICVEVHTHTH